jgi:nucleoid DNA-binding protein/cell division septation protein DedD
MTTVQNHIKELLFEQDCVVIPDFGGFVTNFDCAKINSTKKVITPPQKCLAFNTLLKNDDGLLSNYIAKEENISVSQANLKIRKFVEDIKRYLRFDSTYSIEGLGTFSQNEEDKIQFQPNLTNNFFSESFGMGNIFLKKNVTLQNELQVISNYTIQQVFSTYNREPMAEVLEDEEDLSHKKSRSRRFSPFVYGIFSSIILVSAIYLYDNQKSNLSSLNPFQLQSIVQPTITPFVKKEIPLTTSIFNAEPETKPAIETQPIPIEPVKSAINESENRFFIITGSFLSKQNAKKLLAMLKNNGFENAAIIHPKRNEKLIKVSAAGFSDELIAEEEAKRVAESLNQSTWIYRK